MVRLSDNERQLLAFLATQPGSVYANDRGFIAPDIAGQLGMPRQDCTNAITALRHKKLIDCTVRGKRTYRIWLLIDPSTVAAETAPSLIFARSPTGRMELTPLAKSLLRKIHERNGTILRHSSRVAQEIAGWIEAPVATVVVALRQMAKIKLASLTINEVGISFVSLTELGNRAATGRLTPVELAELAQRALAPSSATKQRRGSAKEQAPNPTAAPRAERDSPTASTSAPGNPLAAEVVELETSLDRQYDVIQKLRRDKDQLEETIRQLTQSLARAITNNRALLDERDRLRAQLAEFGDTAATG